MEISMAFCVILMCLNLIFLGAYCEIKDTGDIKVKKNLHLLSSYINKEIRLKKAFSQIFEDINLENLSINENKNDNELLKVKELDKALDDFIISNNDLTETLNAAQPAAVKILSDELWNGIDVNDTSNWNITKNEFIKDSGDLFRTIEPYTENQLDSEIINDHVNFADLFTLRTFNDNEVSENPIVDKVSSKNQDRTKRENDFKDKNESNDIKNSVNNVKSDTETSTQPMDEPGRKILKLLKEDEEDDDLENVEEEETEKPQESYFKGLPAEYIFPIIRAQNMASSAVNSGYQTVKNVSGGIIEYLRKIG